MGPHSISLPELAVEIESLCDAFWENLSKPLGVNFDPMLGPKPPSSEGSVESCQVSGDDLPGGLGLPLLPIDLPLP